MNNNEALLILKSAIELPQFAYTPNFYEILKSVRECISDQKIIHEIERNNLGEAIVLIDNNLFQKSKFKPYYFLSDLEEFVVEEEVGVTIDEIKKILGIGLLQFCAVKDIAGNVTSYCQHWENQRRINVRIERDLMQKINTNRTTLLNLKKQSISANLGYYYKLTIKEYIKPKVYNFDMEPDNYGYESSYEKYGGYNGYDDDTIDSAFEGDPSNTWNVD